MAEGLFNPPLAPASSIYNLKPSNTAKFRSGMARSDRNCIVRWKGPSTVAGQSTGGGTSQAVISTCMRTAAILQAQGINAGANSFFGDKGGFGAGQGVSFTAGGDARLAFTGATQLGSTESIGGNAFVFPTATSRATFTPQNPVTRFEVLWRDNTAGRNFTATIDAGTAVAINSSGTTALRRTLLAAVSLGTHTIALDWVALGVTFMGVYAYDDTNGRREISFLNDGISGAQSARFISNIDAAAGNDAVNAVYTPDAIFLDDYPINDWRNGVPIATSKANITADVIASKVYGNPVLFTPLWDSGTGGTSAQQDAYAAMIYDIANEQDVPLIDVRASWVSYAVANGLGWYSDSVHPTLLGYNVKANAVAEFIRRVKAI